MNDACREDSAVGSTAQTFGMKAWVAQNERQYIPGSRTPRLDQWITGVGEIVATSPKHVAASPKHVGNAHAVPRAVTRPRLGTCCYRCSRWYQRGRVFKVHGKV